MTAEASIESEVGTPAARHPIGFPALVLVLSLIATYCCALAFVFVLQRSLPPTDGAYGQSFSTTLGDPFVQTIGGTISTAIALVFFPVAVLCLWHRRLLRCGVFVVGTTLLVIGILTPYLGHTPVFIAVISAVVALVVCRVVPIPFFQRPTQAPE